MRIRRRRGVTIGDAFEDRRADLVALTGRDRYPSAQLVRLAPDASPTEIVEAIRTLRAVAGAYRVPSSLLDSSDDVARMRVIAQSWRATVQEWTDAALRLKNAHAFADAARVVNECSTSMEAFLATQRDVVVNGPRMGMGEAWGALFNRTTERVNNIVDTVGTAAANAATGLGFGAALVVGGALYLYFKGKKR